MSNQRRITKSDFLATQECSTKAWKQMREIAPEPSLGEQLRMEEGRQVGEYARQLFPQGILVREKSTEKAIQETLLLLNDPGCTVLFEACFVHGPFVTRTDIILRIRDGWYLVEVKSGFLEGGPKEEYINDIAYTAMILQQSAGLNVRCQIMGIDRNYRLNDAPEKLFTSVDCTEQVMERVAEWAPTLDGIASLLLAKDEPEPKLSTICKNCDYFEESCLGVGIDDSILIIPRITQSKVEDFTSRNISRMRDVPAQEKLTANQMKVVSAAKNGQPIVDKSELRAILSGIQWPIYFLDFETVKTVFPLWPGVAPHEQVVTQYSLHVLEKPDDKPKHHDYLADHLTECRRELTKDLLDHLGTSGSIVVYSTFEQTVLNRLSQLFPEYEKRILAVTARLFDLERVFRSGYYHPDFRGKTSIKVTLPALVNDLSYDCLKIQNGDTAIARFAQLAMSKSIDVDEIKRTRSALLAYCELDTLAMLRLYEELVKLIP